MKLLAGALTTALLTTVSAIAADLPSHKSVTAVPVAVTANRTGYYIGAHAGWGMGSFKNFDKDAKDTQSELVTLLARPVAMTTSGGRAFVGGLYAGYNFQFDKIVTGVEADLNIGSITRTAIIPFNLTGNGHTVTGSFTGTQAYQIGGSLRGRSGYAINDLLPYVTGGLAMATNKWTLGGDARIDGTLLQAVSIAETQRQYGYVLGGGLEYKLSANLNARAEYLYTSFAATEIANTGSKYDTKLNTVRVGLSYKF